MLVSEYSQKKDHFSSSGLVELVRNIVKYRQDKLIFEINKTKTKTMIIDSYGDGSFYFF